MNTKFKRGDKVMYQGNEFTIKVSRKNFQNGHIIYALENGPQVEEKELVKVSSGMQRTKKPTDPELEAARAKYEKLLGKPVPKNKKNKKEWILEQIEKAAPPPEPDVDEDDDDEDGKTPYEILSELDLAGLKALIAEKEELSEIEVDDYEEDDYDDLLVAVCGALEIEIPSEEEEED